ncbi:MAG TPA: bifunctional metallophosphatase/5'-nucleotidase [Bacteroidetes bacterium]|nr:bifunctional metallophosphatase/5'-nucleotidase [Bacteroidota bacterium]
MFRKKAAFLLCALLYGGFALTAQEIKTLTILHSNDLQSRLLPSGPLQDFTAKQAGDDSTRGGFIRLATVLRELRARNPESTLVLDAGDVMMGTLFHTVARQRGTEYRLLSMLGYDAVTLGNHEFDFGPDGLSRILQSAAQEYPLPKIVAANLQFDTTATGDDRLEALAESGAIAPYVIIEKAGLRIGVFGLLGNGAVAVIRNGAPLSFADAKLTAKRIAGKLRYDEKVDLVICLSHSGIHKAPNSSAWTGEDIFLARQVPEIDVVISGHSHTALQEPILIDGTVVVQAGTEARHLGELKLDIIAGEARFNSWRLIDIDDRIVPDAQSVAEVNAAMKTVTDSLLAPLGYDFDQIICETDFDLRRRTADSNIGNLVTDAMRHGVAAVDSMPDIAIEALGSLRADILRGETGVQQVADLFRVVPLGIGLSDEQPGYPLVKIWLTASDIKKALEIITSVYPIRGSSYYLQLSGIRFRYNLNRVLFDRVIDFQLGDEENGYRDVDMDSPRLYSVVMTSYIASFFPVIARGTAGMLDIIARDAHGNPVQDLRDALIDADPGTPGVQELKQWRVFIEYLRSFPDTDGDGIANIPADYKAARGRIVALRSWDPRLLFRNAGLPMWGITAISFFALLGITAVAIAVYRKFLR